MAFELMSVTCYFPININCFVFLLEVDCVLCEVRTELFVCLTAPIEGLNFSVYC
jgi:hypothetical protein